MGLTGAVYQSLESLQLEDGGAEDDIAATVHEGLHIAPPMSDRAMALLNRADSDFFIVSTNVCPYCFKAKRYLDGHRLSWTEVNVQNDRQLRMEFVAMTGHRTVPVVFDIRGDEPIFVGGSDNLEEYL